MYKSEMHNASETKQILKNGSPDIFFKVYHKKKKGPTHPGGKPVKKPTLSQRIDRLEELIANLAKQMNDRFDRIDARLDYIVQTNDLKDLSNK